MCIIAVKPGGVEIDEQARKWLENCAGANRDGGGLMWSDGDKVHWYKGFMGQDAFEKTLELGESLPIDYPIAFHYRIATHGGISRATTHPFSILQGDEGLVKLNGESDVALVHNGIISSMPLDPTYSDTQMLVRQINDIPDTEPNQVADIVNVVGGGSYCVMTKDRVTLIGYFTEEDDWFFSNSTYLRQAWSLSDYYGLPTSRRTYSMRPRATDDEGLIGCLLCTDYFDIKDMQVDVYGNQYCEDCSERAKNLYGIEFVDSDVYESAGGWSGTLL